MPTQDTYMDNAYKLKNIGKFVLLNSLIALFVCIGICPSCFTSLDGLLRIADDYVYSFLISGLLGSGIGAIIQYNDKRYPWFRNPLKRMLFDLVTVTIYSFIVSYILASIFGIFVWKFYEPGIGYWKIIAESTVLPVMIALGLTVFFTSRSFLFEWREAAIDAEKMRSERLAGQYESLKNQLNPHFLFNSLNVLSNLVYENPDRANQFIEKLARIYRYVLEVQEEKLVSLTRELEFAVSYLDLQAVRFGDKFTYSIGREPHDEKFLPPLTLQILLENALKHNTASKEQPLHISIDVDPEKLTVRNNIQIRSAEPSGNGIGLKNVVERYKYLSDKNVNIENNGDFFTVILPLLPQAEGL